MLMKVFTMPSISLLTGVFLVSLVVPSTSSRVGGLEPADVNDNEVESVARFATSQINKMSNAMYASKMTKVIKAQKQVVAGENYYLTIEITETQCKNNALIDNLDSCKLLGKPMKQICEVEVFEQLWIKDHPVISLKKFSCIKGK